MTQSETPARANRLGEPCPAWCIQDHDRIVLEATDRRGTVWAHEHHSSPVTQNGPLAPRVWIGEYGNGARVFASTVSATLHALPGQEAEDLARFIEQLASFSKEQLRYMAADVRTAAAIAREAQ